MPKVKFNAMVAALTEDTSPDLAADFVPDRDTSAVLPKKVAPWRLARGAKGADIASAATVNLDTATGDLVDVTGTTTVTAITLAEGRHQTVRFTGILVLTNGASLVLQTGANITTAAGDFAEFFGYAAGVVRCVYQRASGAALVGGATTASTTEVLTGTDTAKSVTPDSLAALWEQGSDIASAATISVGEGGYHHVTGTTTITDIDFATDKAGRKVWLEFDGILTLTHHATTLKLPTNANIVTAAGDVGCFVSQGSDNVKCLDYTRASGAALVGGIGGSTGATDNRALRADGTGGSTVQSSGVLIDDNGYIAPTSSSAYNVPCIYSISDTDTGIAMDNVNRILLITGGTETCNFADNTQLVGSGLQIKWDNNAIAGGGVPDAGLARVDVNTLKATNGSTGLGWIQDAGMVRVTADVTNDSATFADITGLSVSLQAGRSYPFHAILSITTGAIIEGVKIDLAGTATVTNVIADIEIKSHAATPVFTMGRLAALGGGTGVGQTTADAGNVTVEVSGTFTVNAAGTFKLQFAKNSDTGALNTTIKRGSWMRVWDTP